ncbi:hypothetical protein MYSTI_05697 [Myxococcus stipitatus DSM 14675]|uniref:Uncharacterized protein n=1 Tax=Myxococcus stipitatus (strain DSM 14675 / JCM 12634 / Mx s8) TaxID=1278073 RepID=L7UKL3_MYXSD|nr:hypothetical protein MYSTI_05697 [Myxococcus stipitatus DSM 14675]
MSPTHLSVVSARSTALTGKVTAGVGDLAGGVRHGCQDVGNAPAQVRDEGWPT